MTRLKILHCFRSPVGGIFRHVRDLIHEQVRQGHEVGVICDDNTGGPFEEHNLRLLVPSLSLGLHRISMARAISPADLLVAMRLYKTIKPLGVDIIHCHGAKGGAFGRVLGSLPTGASAKTARLYCPHGGSMHYDRKSLSGRIYFALERFLEHFTDRLIFVSGYERDGYHEKVGEPRCPSSFVPNGLTPEEFEPVATSSGASDFIYIGMMRDLKGVDLFLASLSEVANRIERTVTATLIGDGPDLERYKSDARNLGPYVRTQFLGPMPAREGFALGKTLVVPSRAESMPYIVLEALAAQRPLIATDAGGIPEIYGEHASALVPAGDLAAMSATMARQFEGHHLLPDTGVMAQRIKDRFSVSTMASAVMEAYEAALLDRR